MSIINEYLDNIFNTVMHITLKGDDDEGRLFKDIMTTSCDNIMTVLESIIGHVGHNTAMTHVVEFDKKHIRYKNR